MNPEAEKECLEIINNADSYKKDKLSELYKKYKIKSEQGNELSEPIDFNLMFET